jgi:hypothetical protein
MAGKKHELIPSARRLITSLRDMGYDFSAAVADVVDNSIEAQATKIHIDVRSDGDNSWVRIADNGVGMKPAQIREALRYGTDRQYDAKNALGKFGLGLKTASMSQCQHLTVASRSNVERPEIAAHSWDLEHVATTDRWEIVEAGRDQSRELWTEILNEHTGTVILWRRLDRILGFKNPYGGMAKKRLESMCGELEEHLAMVFHRYLAGEAGRRRVRIALNGTAVRPWDPFVREEKATRPLDPITLHFNHAGAEGEILIEPFVLPHQDRFSSAAAHSAAAGPLRWNRQQGFYIYRANRMIQSGGWSNLRTMDEHTKLARVALSFDPRLDDAFRINVAKMRVQLPRQLREQIESAIAPVIKAAQFAYRRSDVEASITVPSRQRKAPSGDLGDHAPPNTPAIPRPVSDRKVPKAIISTFNGDARWRAVRELRNELARVATAEERPIVLAVLSRLLGEQEIPADLMFGASVEDRASVDLQCGSEHYGPS